MLYKIYNKTNGKMLYYIEVTFIFLELSLLDFGIKPILIS